MTGAPAVGLFDSAAAAVLDCLITAMLGHSAPKVERIAAEWNDAAPGRGATLLSLPSKAVSPEFAAYANAVALCWFELDPGFRHAGCHAALHTLPTLLAASESRRSTIAQMLARFAFCYEVVARLAMEWDTRPSGFHSHGIFSHLGAVIAICAAREEDDAFIAQALDLASSVINCGQSWEVSEGGDLRNLWPGMAAMNAFTLYRAAKAGITTSSGRLEKSFDALFRRREEAELGSRFSGPALLQNYSKTLPACRHLHAVIAASLQLACDAGGVENDAIESIEVSVHPEAAALDSGSAKNLINAQFSLPISVAVAVSTGRYDPQTLNLLREDANVVRLATRVRITHIHRRDYPADRSADVALTFAGGRSMRARIEIADGDPASGVDSADLIERKSILVSETFPPHGRDAFLRAKASVIEAFKNRDTPLSDALSGLR